MRFGKVAILLTIAAAALHCAGNPPVSEPGQAALDAPSAVVIHDVEHAGTPSGTQVVLHGNYPFNYTSYQPDSRTLVVELLDVLVEGLADEIQIGTPQVGGVAVANVQSVDGGTIAKFEFQNVTAAHHAIELDGYDLIVDFPSLSDVTNVPDPALLALENELDISQSSFGTDESEANASMLPPMPFEAAEDAASPELVNDGMSVGSDVMASSQVETTSVESTDAADGEAAGENEGMFLDEIPVLIPADEIGLDEYGVTMELPQEEAEPSSAEMTSTDAEVLTEETPADVEVLAESASPDAETPAEMTPSELEPSSISVVEVAPAPAPAQNAQDDAVPIVVRGERPEGKLAGALLEVKASETEPSVILTADGGLVHEHFQLQSPPRIVIDLVGVVDKTSKGAIPVGLESISGIRVAQFISHPEPVARVVLDMKELRDYAVVPTEQGIMIDFSGRSEETVKLNMAEAPQQVAVPLAAEAPPAAPTSLMPLEMKELAPPPEAAEEATAAPVVQEPALEPQTAEPPAAEKTSPAEPVARDAQFRAVKPAASEDVVISKAEGRYNARSISDFGPKYTGKRISLNFKDADLKDVFRLFHEITGYNIVLDPAVSGKLTIVLENVPEDQALDIILKNNGLDKVFENNVIRIASTQKLAAEAAARRALIEAQELEEEPITFSRSLSYAKVQDVARLLRGTSGGGNAASIMSKRGTVAIDDRTNTLIITDLKDRREPINRLIDALDEQTPQVIIEARIVETDREFERDFGITWGAHAEASQAKGTQTSLDFPHSAVVDYDVALPGAANASTLGISFGNVLDSFTLDATLDAFELNGDVKVLSSPRIATQNNQKATIEQGVQIPVVSTTATQINVDFISASLKLEVTPQITKERTVIMDVRVDNSSPDFINRVGDVPPIITERAQTQILVPDGGTAVIGGIFKLNDSVSEASVPGLGKIPGLGWLFKSKSVNRKNTELLIFITPRIQKQVVEQED